MTDPLTSTPSTTPSSDQHGHVAPRRGFLSLMAFLAGSVAGLVPLVAGALFFMDPVLRKRKGAAGGMLRAADLSELPDDGTPIRVTLRCDVVDAWSNYRNRVVGSVYLRKMPNGEVLAFNDTCTHLGCKVDYQMADKRYFCPCHQSAFSLDGSRQNKTPPRDLDSLKTSIRDGVVWVDYRNFRIGSAKKEVIG